MKIVSHKICPFVQRVTALLEAKSIPYDIEFISLDNKPQWFLDISPNAQVPVLITDKEQAIFESDSIAEYLEETYLAMQPELSAEERAINRAWSYLASKNYLVQCSAQLSPDAATLEERQKNLGLAFDRVEKHLGETKFFGGETLGMVDISWLPLLHRADIINQNSGFDFLNNRPKLKKWQKHLMDTGLAERSVAPDFEESFIGFYLSDETFLGRGRDVEGNSRQMSRKKGGCC